MNFNKDLFHWQDLLHFILFEDSHNSHNELMHKRVEILSSMFGLRISSNTGRLYYTEEFNGSFYMEIMKESFGWNFYVDNYIGESTFTLNAITNNRKLEYTVANKQQAMLAIRFGSVLGYNTKRIENKWEVNLKYSDYKEWNIFTQKVIKKIYGPNIEYDSDYFDN